MKKLENVNEIKKMLFDWVFDGFSDDELGVDFNSNFNKIVGFKEDVINWGEGYFVCVDKDNNVLFSEVSISDRDNKMCVNKVDELYFNVKSF